MRNALPTSMIGVVALLAFSSLAMAQGSAPGTKESLYNGNRLKTDPTPGGLAPVHDVNGTWAGNITPERPEIPALTSLGQKLFSMNKPETRVGTGHSNDPMNTCDPLGIPRNLVYETRGLAFSSMPDRIVILHQYQRIWRYVWMDGRASTSQECRGNGKGRTRPPVLRILGGPLGGGSHARRGDYWPPGEHLA